MDFAKLLIHCQVNSQLPEDEDKPFIIKYQIRVNESDVVDGPELPEEQFRIAISTKRLMRLAGKQDDGTREFTLQVDSTYKLVWNGFTVLVFGFTDLDNEFHPVCLSISSKETHRDYEFLFGSIQYALQLIGKLYFFFIVFFN